MKTQRPRLRRVGKRRDGFLLGLYRVFLGFHWHVVGFYWVFIGLALGFYWVFIGFLLGLNRPLYTHGLKFLDFCWCFFSKDLIALL